MRRTVISPGTPTSEPADTISDAEARHLMKSWRAITIDPEAIGNAILFAISQPEGVAVSGIVVRPTASPH
jgi:NADP-dependent 3-hydroxy acid dehydrogenase YdfG